MPNDILSQFLGISGTEQISTDSVVESEPVNLVPKKVEETIKTSQVDANTRVLADAFRQRIGVPSMTVQPEMPSGQSLDVMKDPNEDLYK